MYLEINTHKRDFQYAAFFKRTQFPIIQKV